MDDEFDRIAASVEGCEPFVGIVVSVGLLQKMVAAMKAKTATMDDLPKLPEEHGEILKFREADGGEDEDLALYTAEQMRSYAMQAVLAERAKERERCARICDSVATMYGSRDNLTSGHPQDDPIIGHICGAEECAAAIRKGTT